MIRTSESYFRKSGRDAPPCFLGRFWSVFGSGWGENYNIGIRIGVKVKVKVGGCVGFSAVPRSPLYS